MHYNYFIAPGTYANWQRAFSKGNIWGLPEWRRPAWESLTSGDVIFFYVESPKSSVVGYSEIVNTFYDRGLFFADDWGKDSKWPLRFTFQTIMPSTNPLVGPGVSVRDMLKFPQLKRFESLMRRQGEELLRRCEVQWLRELPQTSMQAKHEQRPVTSDHGGPFLFLCPAPYPWDAYAYADYDQSA